MKYVLFFLVSILLVGGIVEVYATPTMPQGAGIAEQTSPYLDDGEWPFDISGDTLMWPGSLLTAAPGLPNCFMRTEIYGGAVWVTEVWFNWQPGVNGEPGHWQWLEVILLNGTIYSNRAGIVRA